MTTGTTEGPGTTSPRAADDVAPVLTVVLPVLNEGRDLGVLLDQLRAQDPPPGGYEVLVADGGSTDGTRDLVAERAGHWPSLRLLANPGRRSGPGRNVGARAARGAYVMFLDGHCRLPHDRILVQLVETFTGNRVDCVCRPQPLTALGEEGWSGAVVAARGSRLGHKPGSEIYGGKAGPVDPRSAGAAYTREVLETLGGYDERFDACEDVEFNHRVHEAGFSAWLEPGAAVAYRARSGPGALLRQMFRYGRGRARLMARHPSTAPLSLIGLSVAGVGALVLPLLMGVQGTVLLGALATVYLLIVLIEGIRRAPRRPARTAVCLVMIHAGLLLGFWRGLFDARRFRSPMTRPAAPHGKEQHVQA